MLCCCCLKFLITFGGVKNFNIGILKFERGTVEPNIYLRTFWSHLSEHSHVVQWDNGACLWAEEIMCNRHVCPFWALHLHIVVSMSYKHRNPLLWLGGQSACCLLLNTWGAWWPLEASLPVQRELVSKGERRWWHSKRHERPRNPIMYLLTCIASLFQPTTNAQRVGREGKGEGRWCIVPFPSSSSHWSGSPGYQNAGGKKWHKNGCNN